MKIQITANAEPFDWKTKKLQIDKKPTMRVSFYRVFAK